MTQLEGQTVLVTGANRGMGAEYVTQLLDRGATKIYAAARDTSAITITDDRVVPLQLDVTDPASVRAAVAEATDVGILINNAGAAMGASVLEADTTDMRAELEVNLFGPLATSAAFADTVAERRGAIVNVASVLAWLPVGKSYSVSKAALWMATDSMRLELAPRGVQVLGVYVGLVDTDMGRSTGGDSPKADPADVVRQVLDGLEAGADEVLADAMTASVRSAMSQPVGERLAAIGA